MKLSPTSIWGVVLCLVIFISCSPKTEEKEPVSQDIPITTSSDEALAHYQQGMDIFDDGNGQKARPHFDKAIDLDPNFTMAYVFRARTSRSNEEFKLDTDKGKASMENASEGEKLMVELNQSFIDNDNDKSQSIAKQLVGAYPESARAHVIHGNRMTYRRDHEGARKAYAKAIELAPDWQVGYNALGFSVLFNEPQDMSKAESMMMKVTELNPQSARAEINLGDCYRAQNNLEKARDAYARAVELDPEDPVAYTKKGHANSFLGNYEEARTDYVASQPLSDFKATSMNFVAFTYLYQGDGDAALESLETAASTLEGMNLSNSQLAQNKLACLNSCAMIALHYGKAEHIKELIEKIGPVAESVGISLESDQALKDYKADVTRWQALALAMEGDFEAANNKVEEAGALMETANNLRNMEDYHLVKGYISLKQENYEDAIGHLEKANTDNMYTKYLMAMAHEKNGNTAGSTELLNEISDFNFNGIDYALVRAEVKEKLTTI